MPSLLRDQPDFRSLSDKKFVDPDVTATGDRRATVPLRSLETLWFNTGSLCNITCQGCYIESSPTNDRLAYLTLDEMTRYLDEIDALGLKTREIGFTGGEPFMNQNFPAMLTLVLERGYQVLVLTNAMKPLLRPSIMKTLSAFDSETKSRLIFRVSLDHYSEINHDKERGHGSWQKALAGVDWLSAQGFQLAVAGRQLWQEDEKTARAGYQTLFSRHEWDIDANNPASLVLFPEMDEGADIAEITTDCWSLLDKSPDSVMCSSSRMVVQRKGEKQACLLPCTLIAYDERFTMGYSLKEAEMVSGAMFHEGSVKLNHPHCARFCVLGGASCSPE